MVAPSEVGGTDASVSFDSVLPSFALRLPATLRAVTPLACSIFPNRSGVEGAFGRDTYEGDPT